MSLKIFSTDWLTKLLPLLGIETFDDGTGKQVIYKEQTVSLVGSGNFTGGSIKVTRIGSQVCINALSSITHASSGTPLSAVGVLPEWARPTVRASNIYNIATSSALYRVVVEPDGQFGFIYFNASLAIVALTSSTQDVTISYNV